MDKGYIAPEAALKKLRAARGIRQAVYIYGATGYGKTELAKQYLHNRRYRYISCAEDAAALLELAGSGPYGGRKKQKETGKESQAVAVLDDLHLLKSAEGRNAVLTLTQMQGLWLILIGRSPVPSWLMPSYVGGGFIVVTEDDLCLKEKDIAFYMETQGIALTGEELAFVCEKSRGNAYIVRHAALKIREGMRPGPGMQQEISDAFAEYLEGHVLVQWDSELLEFLMQVSVTEEFTLSLAETVTGNRHAAGLLGRASETGNFLVFEEGAYRLHPVLVKALRRRAAKTLGPEVLKDNAYNAGLWYEMCCRNRQKKLPRPKRMKKVAIAVYYARRTASMETVPCAARREQTFLFVEAKKLMEKIRKL